MFAHELLGVMIAIVGPLAADKCKLKTRTHPIWNEYDDFLNLKWKLSSLHGQLSGAPTLHNKKGRNEETELRYQGNWIGAMCVRSHQEPSVRKPIIEINTTHLKTFEKAADSQQIYKLKKRKRRKMFFFSVDPKIRSRQPHPSSITNRSTNFLSVCGMLSLSHGSARILYYNNLKKKKKKDKKNRLKFLESPKMVGYFLFIFILFLFLIELFIKSR